MKIELKDLHKTFVGSGDTHDVVAIDGVSLTMQARDFVAVHGPSGCGKSTLLLMTGGLMSPDSGEIYFDGISTYDLSRNERAAFRVRNIGFVFQQFYLIPYLNALDNVMVPSISLGIENVRDRAVDLLTSLGLNDHLKRLPSQLSVGEQQRVALARAVLTKPKLILADEPTGNLDAENGRVVLGFLREFADDGGMALMVSHDDRAISTANREVRLLNGKVVEAT